MRVAILLSALVGVVLCQTSPPGVCTYRGNIYYSGQSFQPTPCEHCFCSPDGRAVCAIADCFFTPCVDAIHDPTKCCPVCPNGQNCRHSDGTIIKKGEVYKPDEYTVCECPTNSFGFGSQAALCAVRASPYPTDLVVS